MSLTKNCQCKGQLTLAELFPDSWFGRTYLEHSAPTTVRTSEPCLKKQRESKIKTPLFLDLRGNKKWSPSGCIMGDGWSIAWRVHDAQFWGVPQRRKRIALIADFGGSTAPEILFERKGLPGNTEESQDKGQTVAGDTLQNVDETSRIISFQERAGCDGGVKESSFNTIESEHCQPSTINQCCHEVYGISAYESNAMKSNNPHSGIYKADTTRTLDNNGGNPACNQGGMIVLEGNGSRPSHKGDGYAESETMYTLNSTEHHAIAVENHPNDSRVKISEDGMVQTLSSRMGTGDGNVPMVMEPKEPISIGDGQLHDAMSPSIGVSKTLNCMDDPAKVMVYGLDRASFNQGKNAQYDFQIDEEKIGTQVAKGPGAVLPWTNSVVRRLTPLECERLQGYPDGWTDIGDWVDSKGKKHKGESDAPRYKALGNSIALPFWEWMAGRIVKQLKQDGFENPTMASLFDGISGFCLVYARAGCKPVFSSEIEEFPIAVAKKHFGDDGLGLEGDYEQYL